MIGSALYRGSALVLAGFSQPLIDKAMGTFYLSPRSPIAFRPD
jgi:hypothetical protein